MNKFACRYAVVQFLPYSEVGEFVNVGVVLLCPQTGYFDFKLQTRKHARVTDFFVEISAEVYRKALQLIQAELERIAEVVQLAPQAKRPDFLRQVFEGLIHPREAIIRFSPARAVLTEDPAHELERQFQHHVNRSFATPEYVEAKMAKRIGEFLQTLPLIQPFKVRRVGNDEVHAEFPLVQSLENKPVKIIKPFNLEQGDSNGIYTHGDTWIRKLKRLGDRQQLPPHILFAVAHPPADDAKRARACAEVCAELEGFGLQIVQADQQNQIADFALA